MERHLTPAIDTSSANASTATRGAQRHQAHLRRTTIVYWLRTAHGWLGLWGAILGLLFGTAGIWLNHRAVLKLPASQQRVNAQVVLPDPAPATAQEMAAWLQGTLAMSRPANSIRSEPSRPVAWIEKGPPGSASEASGAASPGRPLMQPERWVISFGGPDAIVQADYWRGNRSVGVTTTSNGFVATLMNMHKGVGMSVAWILLVDTLAGSMIFLSISGVALWLLTHRRRSVGLAIFGCSMALTLGLAVTQF